MLRRCYDDSESLEKIQVVGSVRCVHFIFYFARHITMCKNSESKLVSKLISTIGDFTIRSRWYDVLRKIQVLGSVRYVYLHYFIPRDTFSCSKLHLRTEITNLRKAS